MVLISSRIINETDQTVLTRNNQRIRSELNCIVRNVDVLSCRRRQSLILQIALNWIEQEKKETEAAKEAYMAEHCPSPDLSGDQSALMVSTVARSQPGDHSVTQAQVFAAGIWLFQPLAALACLFTR